MPASMFSMTIFAELFTKPGTLFIITTAVNGKKLKQLDGLTTAYL